jgi:hypothetical protein
LRRAITYEIVDLDKFLKEFANLVDLSVDLSDFRVNPWSSRSDYFGKLNSGNFLIYQQHKGFLNRSIVLKINGKFEAKSLSLFIHYYNQWILIMNFLWLTIFGFFLMANLDMYVGLGLLLVNVIQAFYKVNNYIIRKTEFLKIIEKMTGEK